MSQSTEAAAVAVLREERESLLAAFDNSNLAFDEKLRTIGGDRKTLEARLNELKLEAAEADKPKGFRPSVKAVPGFSVSTFKGLARALAGELDAYLGGDDRNLDAVRGVPKGWDARQPWPEEHIVRGEKRGFGANPALRGDARNLENYYLGLYTMPDVRFVVRLFEHLRKGTDIMNTGGGVNTTEDDGLLGHLYGSNADGTSAGGVYTPLETSFQGPRGQAARACYDNRHLDIPGGPSGKELEQEAFRWMVAYACHHVPRYVAFKGGEPTPDDPTYTERRFVHSDALEIMGCYQFAYLQTELFKRGVKKITVNLPDGFDEETGRQAWRPALDKAGRCVYDRDAKGNRVLRKIETDGRTLELWPGTSADIRTHPSYQHALWIIRAWNPKCYRVAYGGDLKDARMRELYGKTGAMVFDQCTLHNRFTANSGYQGVTYANWAVFYFEGVVADALGSQEAADAFMRAMAGGCSVGMLPEDMLARGKTSYVHDNPDSRTVSRSYLVAGRDVRAFGGAAEGGQTDDAGEWDLEPYGALAFIDPGDRIGPATAHLRKVAIREDVLKRGRPSPRAGGLVSLLLNEVVRGRA